MRIYKLTEESGFTLIELLLVIILIGVLSVSAQSLFSSKDAYADYIIKERVLSSGLLAQQAALAVSANPLSGAPISGAVASLVISRPATNELAFTLQKLGTGIQSYQMDGVVPALTYDGTALGVGSSVTINWDIEANMSDGNDHLLRIVGSQTFDVCIASSGYVYEC